MIKRIGALPTEWFEGYLQDLSARGALHALRTILAGYLGNPAQAQALARWMRALLKERADLRIVNKKHKEQYLQGLGDISESHWQNKIKQQDFVMIICAKLFWEINSPGKVVG